ncbi:hypothetical protein NK662_23320 [Ectobacillus sp. SYSU M60031]|uniref:Uncharacterized protein n=1 Tax=Ectobacillus ponti TaxID=2961894 RepID=A0AA42BSI8_9BACI|nr:hypothetical protein [Ectobacillus ponti]
MQLQQEQPQLVPHLQVLQPQLPFSAPISDPPEAAPDPLLVASARKVVVVVGSTSEYLHPPQPLPHWQLEPHPQLPPQHDMVMMMRASSSFSGLVGN